MFYGGMINVPGAPGNLLAGGNFMGGQGSAINPEAFKRDARQQKIYNKGQGTDNPNEKEIFLRRTGPQLPLAGIPGSSNLPGAIGNMAGIANATFFEGPQLGQATPQGIPPQPYGGAPNRQLTEEEKMRLMREGSPPPPNFREQYLPKAELVPGYQAKYVS